MAISSCCDSCPITERKLAVFSKTVFIRSTFVLLVVFQLHVVAITEMFNLLRYRTNDERITTFPVVQVLTDQLVHQSTCPPAKHG